MTVDHCICFLQILDEIQDTGDGSLEKLKAWNGASLRESVSAAGRRAESVIPPKSFKA